MRNVEVGAKPQRNTTDDCSADTSTTCSIATPSASTTFTNATGTIESLDHIDWSLHTYGDIDWFNVTFPAGGKYWIQSHDHLTDTNNTLIISSIVGIYDSTGAVIPGTIPSRTQRHLWFEAASAGTYYIAVSHGPLGDPPDTLAKHMGTYTLHIAVPQATDACVPAVTTSCQATIGTAFTGEIQWSVAGAWSTDGFSEADSDWIRVDLTVARSIV